MSARALINNEGGRVHREGEAWQVYPEMLSRKKASPPRTPPRQSRRKKRKERWEGGRGCCPRISDGTNMASYLWVGVGAPEGCWGRRGVGGGGEGYLTARFVIQERLGWVGSGGGGGG